MNKITEHNYYESTFANFKRLRFGYKEIELLVDYYLYSFEIHHKLIKKLWIKKGFDINEVSFHYVSSKSFYLIYKGTHLIRISNHFSNQKINGIEVDWISSCFWNISSLSKKTKWNAGIVAFEDMIKIPEMVLTKAMLNEFLKFKNEAEYWAFVEARVARIAAERK